MNYRRYTSLAIAVSILILVSLAVNSSDGKNSERLEPQLISQRSTGGLVDKIEQTARQITVRIDASNPKNGNGSGVIIGRQGKTYYVATNLHVVEKADTYEVVAPDGDKYQVTSNKIIRGEGLDVAILQFNSRKDYQVATLAQYSDSYDTSNPKTSLVFLGGFPASSEPASSEKEWKFTSGSRFNKAQGALLTKNGYFLSDGYELVCTNLSFPGMSGGSLLDVRGRVIGIGGRPEGEPYSKKIDRNLGYVLGVPTRNILALLTKSQIRLRGIKIETSLPPEITVEEENLIANHPSFKVEKPPADADENQWLNYGNGLWRLGRYEEAVAALNQALKLKPDFEEAYYALGLVLGYQKKYPKAVESFGKAVELNPTFYEAWRQQSKALLFSEKYPEALVAIDKAIAQTTQIFSCT